jgi:hypothetical protein
MRKTTGEQLKDWRLRNEWSRTHLSVLTGKEYDTICRAEQRGTGYISSGLQKVLNELEDRRLEASRNKVKCEVEFKFIIDKPIPNKEVKDEAA